MQEDRSRWDDLVGEAYEAAYQRINADVPGLNIIKLLEVSDMRGLSQYSYILDLLRIENPFLL